MTTRHLKTLATALMLLAGWSTATQAQIPSGYYSSLKGKKGKELKTAVYQIIKDATVLSYGSGSGHTWSGFYQTDRTDDNQVIDRYSNDTRYFSSTTSAVSGMNIEHSFPKSWWGGANNQAYKDLYNLMPCEANINSSKSNYAMGEVTSVSTTNGCTKIGTGSQGYQLWEPADKWKGDFARGYMYMATAYQNLTWSGTQATNILTNGEYPTLQQWAYTLYIKWARNDKPDALEIKRNNAVSQIQGNRNPFVDFPNLMEYIWGDSIDYAFDPETTITTENYDGGGSTEPTEETIYAATFTSEDGGCTYTETTKPSGLSAVWVRTSSYGWKGSAYYNKTNYDAQALLTTPEIDLSDYVSATLTFSHAVNFCTSPSDYLTVSVIDAQTGTATSLNDKVTWPAGSSWTFNESGTIDLSGYCGKKVKIGFNYTSTTSVTPTWEIKYITVKGKKSTTAISIPASSTCGAFDARKPFEAYSIDGRSLSNGSLTDYNGIIIIRQNGKTFKVAGMGR